MILGNQSEVGQIKTILIKKPCEAFRSQTYLNENAESHNYLSTPDYDEALKEYITFVDLIRTVTPDIFFLPEKSDTGIDSIYVRDASITTPQGIILCNMGKEQRMCEPEATGRFLDSMGIPVIGQITGEAQLEGGDLIWLDAKTIAVGRTYRTNDAGIAQLHYLTKGQVDQIIVVPMPHWDGPADVFHLMSVISPIDHDLALVYSRLLPVPFRELLLERGIKLVEVPDEEFESMGCNVLALAPRKALMLSNNPVTKERLESAGCEVLVYKGDEISRKGCGGPTCLTRPLQRG